MSTQHTPGPWHTHRTATYIAIRAQARIQVAQLWKSKRAPIDQEADARLIASAPDLLEALKLTDHLLSGSNMNRDVVERKVRAAIAKAEGGAA